METQKIKNLLNYSSNEESNFATKSGICSQTAKGIYNQNNSIKFQTESIKPSFCNHSDASVSVSGDITVTANDNTDVAFENCVSSSTWETETIDVFIDEALDVFIDVTETNDVFIDETFTLQCSCTIWLNIVIITQSHQVVYSSLKEMKFLLIMLI